MANQPKGIRVLCKQLPELFERILGYEEYRDAIVATNGNPKKLREVYWNVLADDYWWEFINEEIVLRGGLGFRDSGVVQDFQMYLHQLETSGKISGTFLSARCVTHFPDNDFSPSIMYFRKEVADTFYGDLNQFPVPDFILELNDEDSEENNRGVKFEEYEKNGVKEYWIMDAGQATIEQYVLENGSFDFKGKWKEGQLTSVVIENLTVDVEIIFDEKKRNERFLSLYKADK